VRQQADATLPGHRAAGMPAQARPLNCSEAIVLQ